jgi:carotenoid cleavage dioxygenase-like enzyme
MGAPIPADPRLRGAFAPMRFEATVEDCIVTQGEIPRELCGGLYRVGPTWKRPTRQGTLGLLAMDGMVQGLVFEDGKATFRNRWVRTPKYLLEEKHGEGMFEWTDGQWDDWRNMGWGDVKRNERNRGIPQGTNNVNSFPFAGEVLASGEQGGPPVALDPITLETKGIVRWSNQLGRGFHESAGRANGNGDGVIRPDDNPDAVFAAHPKWDSATGELFGYIYSDEQPWVTVHVVAPNGQVRSRSLWDAPYSSVAHDIWLTPKWIVLAFQPFVASPDRNARGLGVFGWNAELPIVIALVPRDDLENGPVRYIEAGIEPEYVMHTLQANVVGNLLTLDAPIFDRPPFPFEFDFEPGQQPSLFFNIARSSLGRWSVDLETGKVQSERLSERPAELPKVDERHYGRGYNWGYMIAGDPKGDGMQMKDLLVYDVTRGTEDTFRIRHDRPAAVLEASFAARTPDSPEGDGFLIVPVSRWVEGLGEFLIFDTHDITKGPVCTIELPFRMGWTPHGHYMDFR